MYMICDINALLFSVSSLGVTTYYLTSNNCKGQRGKMGEVCEKKGRQSKNHE